MSHLPEAVLCEIFSYLSVRDLCACCCVCGRWADVLYPSSHFWEERLSIETPDEFREDPFIRNLVTAKDKLAAYQNSWCAIHHSDNIYIKPNKVTIHRKPVAQFSDVARGRRGCSSGQHYWTVVWHGPKFGSSAVVGLATHNVELKCDGYHPLLGMSGDSWGWDLSKSVLRHDGKECEEYPREGSGVKVALKQVIGLIVDMDNRTLAFDVDGKYLGVAFTDLPKVELFPAISVVYGNTEVSLIYHGHPLAG